MDGAEQRRIAENDRSAAHWNRWGPYLSERQWGTVREDYSPDGTAWDYFPHDHARARAYRWGEDGLLGISDRHGLLCLAFAFWNHADPILKERLFGLGNAEGNHGEDVKEVYAYLDNVPTHSWMRMLYRYPQRAFPYRQLQEENRRRGRDEPEFELVDSGIFAEDRYFDLTVEYAKAEPEDLCIVLTIANRAVVAAPLTVLPTLWFRNTWSWQAGVERPSIRRDGDALLATCTRYGGHRLAIDRPAPVLVTENDSNPRLWGAAGGGRYKDAFHDLVVAGRPIPGDGPGTKAAFQVPLMVEPGGAVRLRLRFAARLPAEPFGPGFEAVVAARRAEADEFHDRLSSHLAADDRLIQRQALAGLLWSKQHYHFDVLTWLRGDPLPPPPDPRRNRNRAWTHLHADEVLLMPDAWEYPWFAAWDWAFQCVVCALVHPEFAKQQMTLLLREWYMHPNGQLPAYEWAFGDVNPPIHAWAALRIFRIERERTGRADYAFLERVFQKLSLNFSWWVNRTDSDGNGIFSGGFLGLDNVSVIDRNLALPNGSRLEQADGTAWMAKYCLDMLDMALELAVHDPVYADVASKYGDHFLLIANALNGGESRLRLWDEDDGFYYDAINPSDGEPFKLAVRSIVGLIPIFAAHVITPEAEAAVPGFSRRLAWLLAHRPELRAAIACPDPRQGRGSPRLLALTGRERLVRILGKVLAEDEFLSPYGIRSLSRHHAAHPFDLRWGGADHRIAYEPGVSSSPAFGGNSNWRGPVWFPVNMLLIDALRTHHRFYGDDLRVECPVGSGRLLTLEEVAVHITSRLKALFRIGADGVRPACGRGRPPSWRDDIEFHEFFHAETGAGLGACHQTGWTALIALLLAEEPRR